jgi:hypothetical protein
VVSLIKDGRVSTCWRWWKKFEKQLLESSIERPLSWYRSIDDVDMRWTQSDEELQNFLFKDLSVEQIRLILRA